MSSSKRLPGGVVFPYDFVFIPGTKGEDGGAFDILAPGHEPLGPVYLLSVRALGAVENYFDLAEFQDAGRLNPMVLEQIEGGALFITIRRKVGVWSRMNASALKLIWSAASPA